jgi:iron only hydrogenase large subunit-like protein
MMNEQRFHSVVLDEESCKGCTICVTTCPAEAIRVRDGKARIMAERCIDCGECIRRCPNHAKKARADDLKALTSPECFGKFDVKIALPAPSLYGQFPEKYDIAAIHAAIRSLGFDDVFPVAAATPAVAAATRSFFDRNRYPDLPRPLISSSCPTIIKFIQIRFPTLIDHIVPVIAPMEAAGRMARAKTLAQWRSKHPEVKDEPTIGCFFISPCAGKITEAHAPLGGEKSAIDGVFSMKDLHIPLLAALGKNSSPGKKTNDLAKDEIAWGRAGGEAIATVPGEDCTWLAVDGMDQCAKILEAVEDGKLKSVDFLELMACPNGCVGGPLSVENASLARHDLKNREHGLPETAEDGHKATSAEISDCLRQSRFMARPSLLLDPDYRKAVDMMEAMEKIYAELPGLDCGCCGAPNCHALAEDIVRGNASRTDCIIILKEQYRNLVEKDGHD